ncbi:MAG: redoxin domain-containing protein [Streptosporangiales bacterium]|nr:redoxin domain-containing protein [Streptosporangiales bacterium]
MTDGSADTEAALSGALPVGAQAPEFELTDQFGATTRLADFRGDKAVLLVFYPFSFTGVCTSEMKALQKRIEDFQNDSVQVLGVSCDSAFVQRVFSERERLSFPVLSDHWPHGATAQQYGVFDDELGAARRGTFVIDTDGVVRWQVLNAIPNARSSEAYVEALGAL